MLDHASPGQRFFGRHDELRRLDQIAAHVRQGRSALALISGPAGIGKSSLVARFRQTGACGLDVLATRCSEFDTAPGEPLDRLQRAAGLDSQQDPSTLAGLGMWHHNPELIDRRATGHFAIEVLRGRTSPTMIVVDDLQWAAPPVLDFVELLAAEMDNRPDRHVLLTLITRHLPPDHDTVTRLDRLARETAVHRIDLEAIDEAADADLVRSEAPHADIALVNHIRRSANGNPLMTLAALGHLRAAGRGDAGGRDRRRSWATAIDAPVAHDPVHQWLTALAPEVSQWCQGAAALGGTFDAHQAGVASGSLQPGTVLEPAIADQGVRVLAAAVDLRILGTDGDQYWFQHDLYREYLYRALPAAERQAVHTRMARHLLASTSPPSPVAAIRLGRHLLDASPDLERRPEANDALRVAARAAFCALSWAEAALFYEAHLAGAVAEHPKLRFEVLLEAGLAHYFNHSLNLGLDRLVEAIGVAKAMGDTQRWAAALVPLMRIRTAGDAESLLRPVAMSQLDDFLAEPRDPLPMAQVLQTRAESLIHAGVVDEGEQEAARSLALARQSGDQLTMAFAGFAHGYAAMTRCAPMESIVRLEQAQRAAEAADDWFALETITSRQGFAHFACGHLEQAHSQGLASVRSSLANHNFTNRSLSHALLGSVAYLRGDFSQAARMLDQAESESRRAGYAATVMFSIPTRVLSLLATDAQPEARQLLSGATGLPGPTMRALGALVDPADGGAELGRRPPGSLRDFTVGLAAAAIMTAADDSQVSWDDHIELLRTAMEGGTELATTMPILIRRALGRALTLQGQWDEAAEQLSAAASFCRSQWAHCELALVLIQLSELNARLDRRPEARDQALEADRLGQRLGMPTLTRRARRIHAQPDVASAGKVCVILMSDVTGSTTVSAEQGDRAYYSLVMEHHELVRQSLNRYGGAEFSEGGDSLLAWFESADTALACAQAIQSGAEQRRQHEASVLNVKVGIAAGEPFFEQGRPYGSAVNRAARVTATAEPNQIRADDSTMRLAPIGYRFRSLTLDLRGMGRQRIGILTNG